MQKTQRIAVEGARDVLFHQVGSVPRPLAEPRLHLFEERQIPSIAEPVERRPRQGDPLADLSDGQAAAIKLAMRSVTVALRLLQARRRRLERLLSGHDATANSSDSGLPVTCDKRRRSRSVAIP